MVHQRLARIAAGLCATLPALAMAQVSIASPAQSILQILSAGFAIIAGIGVIFCTIAGIFGFAQWTRLLNVIGWIVAGGGGLALATYAAALAV
jgi:type IV secretory pathway VirB2 component (pilin)